MKRVLLLGLAALPAILLGIIAVISISAYRSLDRDLAHTRATTALPLFSQQIGSAQTVTMSLVDANGMQFRTRAAGFGGTRGNVVLLHGFPESSVMYEPMIPVLAAAGYQVIAFDQRGYSPGARPDGIDAYTTDELVADVFAVADAVGFETFHLVGHDWGAAVGWRAVFSGSPRIESWTPLSIPHMGAYAEAIANDADQQQRSAYLRFLRLPWLPEMLFSFNDFAMLRENIYGEHGSPELDEYLAIFSEPGALTAALNWYRASELQAASRDLEVAIPTTFVWGNRDPVVGDLSLELQRRYFDGNLFEVELETGHWLMQTHASEVSASVLAHLERQVRDETDLPSDSIRNSP
jgi:pimeloyl-ACP methyl ester carboxylesterase